MRDERREVGIDERVQARAVARGAGTGPGGLLLRGRRRARGGRDASEQRLGLRSHMDSAPFSIDSVEKVTAARRAPLARTRSRP